MKVQKAQRMSFPLYRFLSFVVICKRVGEIGFVCEWTFENSGGQFCGNKLNNSSEEIETVVSKAGYFISLSEISPKID